MKRFLDLNPMERLDVINRWEINKVKMEDLFVKDSAPYIKTDVAYMLAGKVRPESLVCGGFHNREVRMNRKPNLEE